MMISSKPLRPPQNRSRSATRSLFTAGTVALFLISGTAGALAQPTITPAPTPSAAPDAVPAQRAPAPVDPCATPTTTAPTTTTTAPPTTTTAVPTPSCDTVPAAPEATTSAVIPPAAQPLAPVPAPAAPAPALADAPLPAEPAADQPVEPENDDLSSKTAEPDPDWAPTEDPNATIVPGEMRSDREEIPAPFTKEDADKAETMEARQRMSRAAAGCQTYWPSPYEVCGIIRDKYNSLGGPASFLSFPNSPEYTNPNNSGKRTQFLNGPIYWSAATGAHPVVNSFLNRWGIHQYEAGWLKYPTTDEIVLPDGGRRQEFQQGAIYVAFQNAVGSAIQNGPLRDKYSTVGGLAPGGTLLGYLTEDHKRALPDGQGQMARFQNGVIYWHPTHGARVVRGSVLDQWASAGYEQGDYGYPIADEVVGGTDDTTQEFQGASIRSFRLFEGQFEYLEEDAAIKICQFQGRGDIVHWSRTWRDGVQIKDTASAHVTWKALRNCRPDTTAKLTAQLQVLEDDGSWSDRGALGSVPNARSGGGSSGNRAPANYACRGFGGNIWRVEGDVDINGGPDAADKHYGPNTLFPCE